MLDNLDAQSRNWLHALAPNFQWLALIRLQQFNLQPVASRMWTNNKSSVKLQCKSNRLSRLWFNFSKHVINKSKLQFLFCLLLTNVTDHWLGRYVKWTFKLFYLFVHLVTLTLTSKSRPLTNVFAACLVAIKTGLNVEKPVVNICLVVKCNVSWFQWQ